MIVYLVSGNANLFQTLDRFVERFGSAVEIRQCRRMPQIQAHERLIVVLDLRSPRIQASVRPVHCQSLDYVALVRPDQRVPLRWVEFVQRSRATIVKLRPGARALADLLALLEQSCDGVSPDELAGAATEELEVPHLHDLMRFMFERPWQVRRKRDLERASGLRSDELKNLCRAAGFSRVEHLLTAARGTALNYLVATRRLSVGRARTILAIGNPSNFRRQMRRAGLRAG